MNFVVTRYRKKELNLSLCLMKIPRRLVWEWRYPRRHSGRFNPSIHWRGGWEVLDSRDVAA